MKSKYWTQKDGTKIEISDMSDTHLINTIKMLERVANKRAAQLDFPCLNGEMAQFYAESEWDSIMENPNILLPPVHNELLKEADKRKLKY